jgi:hypothetical protein
MKLRYVLPVALFPIIFALPIIARQQAVTASPQALQLLHSALTALTGSTPAADVTLSGTAHYIAGSDDETGTAVLKALTTGASRVDLSLPSGQRSEVRNLTGNLPAGDWSGDDGVNHAMAYHNLLSEPAWFSPVTTISHQLAIPGFVATYVAAETLDSQNVQHISLSQQPAASIAAFALFPHLTQVDLYLDSSTFLPAAMTFSVHPDDNELVDIPIDVRFSDYRLVNGTQVPFHIQRFLNNGLVLDIQLENAAVNTGLPSTTFGVS